jgi:hypothetical protein
MATNLNPGADATLVQAATNAAMANVPLDQSKAYAQLAAGYEKFADGMVSMYAPIAKQVGEAAAPLVEKVKEKVGENLQELWLNINKHFKDDWTVQPDEKGKQITSLVEEWEASAGEGNLLESFSTGNYNSADIEKFQTQIEELYPNAFPKWGTDGRMGLETETAIKNLLKDKEEYSKSGPTILPGETFAYTDKNGRTSNISLTGQDEYIQGLKDENANAEAMFANDKMSKKDKDDLISANLAKAQNAKNSVRAFSKEQVRVMNLINNDNFNPMASGAMGMDFINAAIERGRSAADGSRVVRGYDDDGNIALIWIDKYGRAKTNPTTGKSWVVSQGQMKKFIVEKDTESEVSVTKTVTTDQQALGKSGVKFNGQEVMNNITKMVSNEKTFLHMINTSIADNTGTFREHVYGAKKDENGNWVFDPTKLSQEIYTQLTMLGGRFDADGNDRVDAQDFVSDENKAALANYLTSYNPTSVNAFASFMRDTAEGYHAQGAGIKTSSGGGGGGSGSGDTYGYDVNLSGSAMLGGRQLGSNAWAPIWNSVASNTKDPGKGSSFNWKNMLYSTSTEGQWFKIAPENINSDGSFADNPIVIGSTRNLIKNELKTNDSRFAALYEGIETGGETETDQKDLNTILTSIGKISGKGKTIGNRTYAKGTLFKYDDSSYDVTKNLNDEYGKLGFVFNEVGNVEDVLSLKYVDPNTGTVEYYKGLTEFDNVNLGWFTGGDASDVAMAADVEAWMKKIVKKYYNAGRQQFD